MMDLHTSNPQQEDLSTHPMPDVRLANVFAAGYNEVQKRYPNRTEEYVNNFRQAATDIRELWDTLQLPAPSFADWRDDIGNDVVTYRKTLDELEDSCLDRFAWQRADEIRARTGQHPR